MWNDCLYICIHYFTICLVFDFQLAETSLARQVLAPTWDQLAEKLQGAPVPFIAG